MISGKLLSSLSPHFPVCKVEPTHGWRVSGEAWEVLLVLVVKGVGR